MKLYSQSASFSSNITHLSQQYVFYCIYKLQNFIPKNFDNALIEFVQTLSTSRRLWEVKAPLSDFRKNLLVPRNPKQAKSVMTSLRCYDNCDVDTVNSLHRTTSRKRPPPVSDHFVNNRFVSQSNTVLKTLS